MKPAAFEYFAPRSLEEALELKSQHGDEMKILAGGQSLIPAMNFRVAQPTVLSDLNKIDSLRYITEENGELVIGAMTVQAKVETSELVKRSNPLVHETIPHIAHPQIRNRGTFGGNMAHADPASELPVVAIALKAKFKAQNTNGDRWIDASDFFQGFFTVSLDPDEILTEVTFPKFPNNAGWSFQEIARRHGDYAMAGIAVILTLDSDQVCDSAKLVYLNVGEGPIDALEAAKALIGTRLEDEAIEEAANTAADTEISPFGNVHASPDYQKYLSKVLTRRAVKTAAQRAIQVSNS